MSKAHPAMECGTGDRGSISSVKSLTTKYSMVYREKDACPEKKDFLQNKAGTSSEAASIILNITILPAIW